MDQLLASSLIDMSHTVIHDHAFVIQMLLDFSFRLRHCGAFVRKINSYFRAGLF
jgi:hypothetical protein